MFCALWTLRADVRSFVFLFCHFSQVLSRSVTQSVRGPERLDLKKTESFDFRRRRTLPILLSMLSSLLSASWATHVSACQQAQVRNLWNFKNVANLNARSTEAHNYVAALNGFGSFTVLWLLRRPISRPCCWCKLVRNLWNLKNVTNMKAWITEAHNYVAASNGFGSFTVYDFWHETSVDLAVGLCWWEMYGIPKMTLIWTPEALKLINVRDASLYNQSVTAVTHGLLTNNPWVTAAWRDH